MKPILFSIALIAGLILFCDNSIYAQNNNNNTPEKGPRAVITYKTERKPDPFMKKLNELSKGDEFINEKTLMKIYEVYGKTFKNIIPDSEYDKLDENQKTDAIKESDIINIINQIKNK